ncbi:FadR/GntR family transcriptional regulator [Streptomyces cucumeris]|uniref:FadR/GntR family transcriptional regulator n=1 Tax=Streptomyces cucumeris TaxID=2962890 RepID=UPI003D7603E3
MTSYAGRGVHGRVVQRLGARIVAGALAEGEILDVRALGAELDVSLTVMRESLKVLAGKGLIDARQKRGTFVRPRSAWNLLDADVIRWRLAGGDGERLWRDLTDVRAAVAPAAAHRAALRRGDTDLAALEAALTAMERGRGDPAAEAEAAASFQHALHTATGNELLARLELVLAPAPDGPARPVRGRDDTGDPVPGHRRVLEAVRDRDAPRAEGAMLDLLAGAAEDTP